MGITASPSSRESQLSEMSQKINCLGDGNRGSASEPERGWVDPQQDAACYDQGLQRLNRNQNPNGCAMAMLMPIMQVERETADATTRTESTLAARKCRIPSAKSVGKTMVTVFLQVD